MGVAKVILNGDTLMDVTQKTVTADTMLSGTTALGADGENVTGSIIGKAASTYTPGVVNQTIASGQYLTGAQTILGDANLVAANIASGVSIFGVTGTHSGGGVEPPSVTITSSDAVNSNYARVSYNGTTYWAAGDSFSVAPGGTLTVYTLGKRGDGDVYVNGVHVSGGQSSYAYILPDAVVEIVISGAQDASANVYITTPYLKPEGTTTLTANGAYDVGQYASAIVSVPGGGDSQENAIIMRTVSETYENSAVTKVGNYAFYSCPALTSVSFPAATTIGISAFQYCFALISVSFPSATAIGGYAFANCTSLASVSFPSALTIGSYAFHYCIHLSSVSFPLVSTIASYAFFSCSALTSVNFPSTTTINSNAFAYCSALTSVSFPSTTTIGSSAFASCTALTSISLPAVTIISGYAFQSCSALPSAVFSVVYSVGTHAFRYCYALSYAEFPVVQSVYSNAFAFCSSLAEIKLGSALKLIGSYAFSGCTNLLSVDLTERPFVPTLSANAFSGTPMLTPIVTLDGTVYGSVYVQASLVDAYKVSTNWTLISNRIVGVSSASGTE